MSINTTALKQTIVNDVFMIWTACLFFFCPRLIENKGAPPLPNKLANAVMITTSGKHSPTAPSADVPICGIRAI